jgi:hypothetical protein
MLSEKEKENIIYGECYLSAIMHNKSEFGLKNEKRSKIKICFLEEHAKFEKRKCAYF